MDGGREKKHLRDNIIFPFSASKLPVMQCNAIIIDNVAYVWRLRSAPITHVQTNLPVFVR